MSGRYILAVLVLVLLDVGGVAAAAPRAAYALSMRFRVRYELAGVRRVLLESEDWSHVQRVLSDLRPFAVLEPRFLVLVDDRQTGQTMEFRPDTPF